MKWNLKELIFPNNCQLSLLLFFKNKSNNTIVSLSKIINVNVNVKFYDYTYVFLSSLRSISQYDLFSPLYVPIEQHDNIMDENNRRESIEFEISVSIVTNYFTYDYNDTF